MINDWWTAHKFEFILSGCMIALVLLVAGVMLLVNKLQGREDK